MEKACKTLDAVNFTIMQHNNMNMDLVDLYTNYPNTELPIELPTKCPCCNRVLASNLLPIIAINNIENRNNVDGCDVISVYRCTDCNSLFVVHSKNKEFTTGANVIENHCEVISSYPFENDITNFSKVICNLSQNFVNVYNEAEKAEHQGLTTICGMGYRRALEFLVDAYIRKDNSNLDVALPLSHKISTYIVDTRIKELATKATWLGNDHTHIVNSHPDRNVKDIKKFINAIVKVIETENACADAATIQRVK